MDAIVLVGVGTAATLASWSLARGARDGGVREALRSGGRWREAVAWLDAAGMRPPVAWLADVPAWREAAGAVASSTSAKAWSLSWSGALTLLALAPWAAALVGFVVAGSLPGAAVCGAAACAGPSSWAAARRRRRNEVLARQVPDVFRSLAGAMASGRTLAQAVSYVGATGRGPLQREFARASLVVSCGTPATEALTELAGRTKAPGVPLMVTALVVSARTGAPLQGLFLRSARLVERRFELERELSTKTAQVRLSARIVTVLPVLLVGSLALLSPDFRAGLATPVGAGSVCVAACLDVTALLIIRSLLRGVV